MKRLETYLFWLAATFVVYMPFHVFIVQSVSLLTGGLEAWEVAKDIILALLVPILLYSVYVKKLYKQKIVRNIIIVGGLYSAIHLAFIIFDNTDDTYSAIAGTVFNVRLFGYLLLGLVVGVTIKARQLRLLTTLVLSVGFIVSLLGVAQYFLPHDLLENVGYSIERGSKPMFFIDDNPELPRVMSTLKDPNSLGAYLIIPAVLSMYALISPKANKVLFYKRIRTRNLFIILLPILCAIWFTHSRGALIALLVSFGLLYYYNNSNKFKSMLKKYWYVMALILLVGASSLFIFRDSGFVNDYVLHAAETSNDLDPNTKRVVLYGEALQEIVVTPLGHGPGTAGLIAISNPKEGILTENYYLQIAYEVGWVGVLVFVAGSFYVVYSLFTIQPPHVRRLSIVLVVAFAGYLFHAQLIHLWSNEAVALQWWLLAGTALGAGLVKSDESFLIDEERSNTT